MIAWWTPALATYGRPSTSRRDNFKFSAAPPPPKKKYISFHCATGGSTGKRHGTLQHVCHGLRIFNGSGVETLEIIIEISSSLSIVETVIVANSVTLALKIPVLRRLD